MDVTVMQHPHNYTKRHRIQVRYRANRAPTARHNGNVLHVQYHVNKPHSCTYVNVCSTSCKTSPETTMLLYVQCPVNTDPPPHPTAKDNVLVFAISCKQPQHLWTILHVKYHSDWTSTIWPASVLHETIAFWYFIHVKPLHTNLARIWIQSRDRTPNIRKPLKQSRHET